MLIKIFFRKIQAHYSNLEQNLESYDGPRKEVSLEGKAGLIYGIMKDINREKIDHYMEIDHVDRPGKEKL